MKSRKPLTRCVRRRPPPIYSAFTSSSSPFHSCRKNLDQMTRGEISTDVVITEPGETDAGKRHAPDRLSIIGNK